MNIGLCVGLVIAGCVCGYLALAKLAKRVEWYVPSVTTAELCREIQTNLLTLQALNDGLIERSKLSQEALNRILLIEQKALETSEIFEESLDRQLRRRFSEHMPHISEDLLRRVASQIASEFSEVVGRRTMSIGSEYVLLQDIDDFSMDVKLDSYYSDVETLQQAIVAALRYEVKRTDDKRKLADWLEAKQWNNREFHLFAGRVGAELFKLKWHGTLQLRKKGQSHVSVA